MNIVLLDYPKYGYRVHTTTLTQIVFKYFMFSFLNIKKKKNRS